MDKSVDTYPICTRCDRQFKNLTELNEHLANDHGYKKPIADVSAAPADLANRVATLEADNAALTSENKSLAAELDEAQKANGDLAKKISELEDALDKANKAAKK